MLFKFQLRRDTNANWTAANPILLDGEPGVETDTKKFKLGDGVSHWSTLPYYLSTDSLAAYVQSLIGEADPLTPEEFTQITDQVLSTLEISDLTLLWQNAKA